MHYKNGREAKVGDKVVGKDCGGAINAGTIVEIQPGSTTCNARLVPPGTNLLYVTLGECLHIDDAMAAAAPATPPPG